MGNAGNALGKATRSKMSMGVDAAERLRLKILERREALRLTAAVVAKKIGISRPFYTQLEGGTRRMDTVYMFELFRALSMDASEVADVLYNVRKAEG